MTGLDVHCELGVNDRESIAFGAAAVLAYVFVGGDLCSVDNNFVEEVEEAWSDGVTGLVAEKDKPGVSDRDGGKHGELAALEVPLRTGVDGCDPATPGSCDNFGCDRVVSDCR